MKKMIHSTAGKYLLGFLMMLSLSLGIYFGTQVAFSVGQAGTEVLFGTPPEQYVNSKSCLSYLASEVREDIYEHFAKRIYYRASGTGEKTAMQVYSYKSWKENLKELKADEGVDVDWGLANLVFADDTAVEFIDTYSYKALKNLGITAVEQEAQENDVFQEHGNKKPDEYVQVEIDALISTIKDCGRKLSRKEYIDQEDGLFYEEILHVSYDEEDEEAETTSTSIEESSKTDCIYIAEVEGNRWEYWQEGGKVKCSRFGLLKENETRLFYNKADLDSWAEQCINYSSGDKKMYQGLLTKPICYFDTLVRHYISDFQQYEEYAAMVKAHNSENSNYHYTVRLDNEMSWTNLANAGSIDTAGEYFAEIGEGSVSASVSREDLTDPNDSSANTSMTWSCDMNGYSIVSSLSQDMEQYFYNRLMDGIRNAFVETSDGSSVFMKQYLEENNAKISVSIAEELLYNDFISEGTKNFEENQRLFRYAKQYLAGAVIMLLLALLLFVCLCLTVGYGDAQNTMAESMLSFRIPTEIIVGIPICLLCIEYAIVCQVNFSTERELLQNIFSGESGYVSFVLIVICWSTIPFAFELLSRIRHRQFFQKSFCFRLFKWVYKNLILALRSGISCIKSWGQNQIEAIRIDKRLSAMFLISQIILFVLVSVGGYFFFSSDEAFIFFMLLAFLLEFLVIQVVFRDIRYTMEIVQGVEELEQGNLEYQIETEHMRGHKKELAENINHLRDGLKLAVEQSIKDERLKTELITNVSHDIKTPLTSIINYVDLLKKEPISGEKAVHYLEVLDQKSQRLKQLMEDLVEVSKSASGNVDFVPMKLDLIELLRQTIGEFEDKFNSRGLTVIENFKIQCAIVNLDSRHTFRVFENLCQNIYKYAMENSRIYVDVTREDTSVQVVMKNMSQYALNISADELMERFVRGDESRNTSGSGLGLSIAKNLVTLQQGAFYITLDGDLFKVTVTFPLVDTEAGKELFDQAGEE